MKFASGLTHKLLGAAAVAALLATASPASAAFVFHTGEIGGSPFNLVGATDVNSGTGSLGSLTMDFSSTQSFNVVTGAATIFSNESTGLDNLYVEFSPDLEAIGWNVELLTGRDSPDGPFLMTVSVNGGITAGADYFTVNPLAPPMKYWISATGADSIDTLDFTFDPSIKGFKQFRPDALGGSPPVAVPEPATWAMLIGGFAMVGAMVRRRRFAIA
jgi:hypothetical protein